MEFGIRHKYNFPLTSDPAGSGKCSCYSVIQFSRWIAETCHKPWWDIKSETFVWGLYIKSKLCWVTSWFISFHVTPAYFSRSSVRRKPIFNLFKRSLFYALWQVICSTFLMNHLANIPSTASDLVDEVFFHNFFWKRVYLLLSPGKLLVERKCFLLGRGIFPGKVLNDSGWLKKKVFLAISAAFK